MGYIYDTHVHTIEGSACGQATGAEHVRRYKELGYQGIIITDHFFNGNTAVPFYYSWKKKLDKLYEGYENAKREGDKIGLQVFFGWESCYAGTDFLIYGLDKEWLLEHKDILSWSEEEQYKRVKEDGGMVIQAHPFRKAVYIKKIRLFPDCVDGIEVWNQANEDRNVEFNRSAKQYAEENHFITTGGSDAHSVNAPHCGMEFDHPLEDIHDFIRSVKSGEGYEIRRNIGCD